MDSLFRFNFWSLAVPAAIISAYAWALRRARQAGLNDREFETAIQWTAGLGLVISHVFEIVMYQPHRLEAEGFLTLLKFWDGLSSFGGLIGGMGTLVVYYSVIKRRRWWPELDAIAEGFFVGWIFGRLGCTVALDHPGSETDFFLAFRHVEHVAGHTEDHSACIETWRHNLGFYEMLWTVFVMVPMNLWLHRRKPPVGTIFAATFMAYGVGRFALDFLRAQDISGADPRYGGLTLAHYLSVATFLIGLTVFVLSRGGRLGTRPADGVERK